MHAASHSATWGDALGVRVEKWLPNTQAPRNTSTHERLGVLPDKENETHDTRKNRRSEQTEEREE